MALSTSVFASAQIPYANSKATSQGHDGKLVSPLNTKWSLSANQSLISTSSFKDYDHPIGYKSFTEPHGRKLEEVKQHLRQVVRAGDSLECLVMVDALQRLAVNYHFEEEIGALIERQLPISATLSHHARAGGFYESSLRFRLLRQAGYHVTSDVFERLHKKLRDEIGEGNPKSVNKDILGLTSLYEASQLCTEEEDIVEEVGELSGRLLNASLMRGNIDGLLAKFVKNTLANPSQRSLPRFTANNFRSDFVGSFGWKSALWELANLDSHLVRSLHQTEMLQVSKWWEELGLAKDLKYARDQPIKWYMWPMAILSDPALSRERILLTQPIAFIYIIDDIFDVYGSIKELTSFTQAVNRWDCKEDDEVPEYMKMCFRGLDEMTNEISSMVYRQHGWNPLASLRKTWASLFNAFLVEAKWLTSGHSPTTEEYLKNAIVSSGVHVLMSHIFFLLGKGITAQSVANLENLPGIVASTASILRLWDDLGSAKDENQEGRDASYVEYYKREFSGSTEETAREHVRSLISKAWKQLNKQCLYPQPFTKSFADASLNTARMVPLMYSYDDDQCLPLLEEHLKSLVLLMGPSGY